MTLRTRSVLGHRLSQRLSSRLGRTAGRKGSAIFDRLGVDDPWASSPRALRGFDLVYLTLPPDDEEELVEEDETAAQLMARMSRQVKRSRAQRRKPSSRRRMLDRIEMTERERPGVRSRMARARGLERTARPSHASLYESSFIYTEPEEAFTEVAEVEEPVSRWGRSRSVEPRARRAHRAPQTLTIAPPQSDRSAGRITKAEAPVRAVRPRSITTPVVRAERPLTRALAKAEHAQPILPASAGDSRAHEAVTLLAEARKMQDDAARVLRSAARRVQQAPAHRRERVVREALRALPPVARRAASATVQAAPRTGASPVASVAARFEGVGRGQRALRPAMWGAPSLVSLTFEEPPAVVPETTGFDDVQRVAPRTRPDRAVTQATRDVRTQRSASRAGPQVEVAPATAIPSVPPTEKLARRVERTQEAAVRPTLTRGLRAVTQSVTPANEAVARVVARAEAAATPAPGSIVPRAVPSVTPTRSTVTPTRSAVARAMNATERRVRLQERLDQRTESPTRGPVTSARAVTPIGARRSEVRTTSGTVRASRRAEAGRSRSIFGLPTSYVVVEPEPVASIVEDALEASGWSAGPVAPSARMASTRTAGTGMAASTAPAARAARRDAFPAVELVATRAVSPRVRSASLPAERQTIRVGTAPAPTVGRTPVATLAAVDGLVDRIALRTAFGSQETTSPSVRAVGRSTPVARDARGRLQVAAPRAAHVVRRSALWAPTATVLQPELEPITDLAPTADAAPGQPRVGTSRAAGRRPAVGASPAARPMDRAGARPSVVSSPRTVTPSSATPPAARAALRGVASARPGSVLTRPVAYTRDVRISPAASAPASAVAVRQGAVRRGASAPARRTAIASRAAATPVVAPTSRGVARAVRRGDSLRRLSAGGALWPTHGPMVHLEAEEAPETAAEALTQPGRAAVVDRAVRSGRREVAARADVISRAGRIAEQSVVEPSVVERMAARAESPDTSPAARTARAGAEPRAARGETVRRSTVWTPSQTLLDPTLAEVDDAAADEVVDRPTARAARRSVESAVRDVQGRDTGRDRAVVPSVATSAAAARVVRADRFDRPVGATLAAARASGDMAAVGRAPAARAVSSAEAGSRPSSIGRRSAVAPTARAIGRDRVRGLRRGRAVLSVGPVSYLEPELTEALDLADAPPAERVPTTARVAARAESAVRVDSRGVGQITRRPTAYVDMGASVVSRTAGQSVDASRRGGVRRSQLAWMPRLDVVLEGFDAPSVATEDAPGRIGPAATRGARPAGTTARRAQPGESSVFVEARERVIGTPTPGARRNVVTRVRNVPAGASGWAASRLVDAGVSAGRTDVSSSAGRTRLAKALGRGQRVAVSPVRFARLAGDLSWLEVAESERATGTPAGREALAGRIEARGEAADRTVGRGAEPVGRVPAFRPLSPADSAAVLAGGEDVEVAEEATAAPGFRQSPSTRALSRMQGRRAPSGTARRPFSGDRAIAAESRTPNAVRRRRPRSGPSGVTLARTQGAELDQAAFEDVPTWAQRDASSSRAGGRDRMIGERSSFRAEHPIVNALARASSPQEIAQLVSDGRYTQTELRSALPAPAVKLVERIVTLEQTARQERREEARHVMGLRMRGTAPDPDFIRPKAASSRTSSGGPRQFFPVASAESSSGLGAARVTQLANKLLNLIHLAEVEQRVEDAQSHVRMSDSDPGSASTGGSGPGSNDKYPNMKALKKDVFESVLSELESIKTRSVEDPDGHAKWW